MAEEIDDNEFFQQDFTTASEWEIFNARLEEVFYEWKLPYVEIGEELKKDQLSLCEWELTTENVYFADVELAVTRYRAKIGAALVSTGVHDKLKEHETCQAFIDLMSSENNYLKLDEKLQTTVVHPLARWYGLRDFLIVSPTKKSISNESQIRILLSSVHIAVSESNCEVPVFVQVLDKFQNVYLGVCEHKTTRLNFDIVHLHTTPPTCKYLSGLLGMFKGKIDMQYVDSVIVTIRLVYNLTKFYNSTYVSPKRVAFGEDDDEDSTGAAEHKTFHPLPFGVSFDPVKDFLLYCTWPQVAENLIIDSPIHTDLDPMMAQTLSLRIHFEDFAICFMSECLQEFLSLTDSRRTLPELLGDSYIYGGNVSNEKNPLDVLTESKIPAFSSVIPNLAAKPGIKKAEKVEGPIEDDVLMQMLYYLFPDAQKSNSEHVYQPFPEDEPFDPLKLKTAYPDSLVHRLSCLLALCHTSFGGAKAVAQFWAEFTQEMRYRVENCVQIPGVAKGFPDSRTCLLHQKLQLLNVCMERRQIREGGLPFNMMGKRSDEDEENEGEDVFFDCSDEEDENRVKHAPWNKPEGRLTRIANFTLVDSDEPLYVPITQDPVPKTEDQLEDDAEVMLQLGPGSDLQLQLMSASLLSDMESFKAANPNGKLEDFIRWYSPRDWIEDDENSEEKSDDKKFVKGRLSSRMLIPGNTWQLVWGQAKPVSARRQKRLFDDAKEAEKILHFLESMTMGALSQLNIATLFHSAIIRLQDEFKSEGDDITDITDQIERIVLTCCKLSRENWTTSSSNQRANSNTKWQSLLTEITNLEFAVEEIRSVRKKLFPNVERLSQRELNTISNLLKGMEVEFEDGVNDPIAQRVFALFRDAKKAQNEQSIDAELSGGGGGNKTPTNVNLSLPNALEKQFTLRVSGKTQSKGMGGPQFMRAILGQNEFRLCGAFSQDTTFY